jgi:hypothetical protein
MKVAVKPANRAQWFVREQRRVFLRTVILNLPESPAAWRPANGWHEQGPFFKVSKTAFFSFALTKTIRFYNDFLCEA